MERREGTSRDSSPPMEQSTTSQAEQPPEKQHQLDDPAAATKAGLHVVWLEEEIEPTEQQVPEALGTEGEEQEASNERLEQRLAELRTMAAPVPAFPWVPTVQRAPRGGRAQGPHICVYCPKVYRQRSSLVRHIRTYHWGVRYRCLQCRKDYARRTTLRSHQICTEHQGMTWYTREERLEPQ